MIAYAQDAIRVGPKTGIEADTGSAAFDLFVVLVLLAFGAWLYVRVRRTLRGS